MIFSMLASVLFGFGAHLLDLNLVTPEEIDVENYEEKILTGAINTIRRNKPVLIIEILGHKGKAIEQGIDILSQTIPEVSQKLAVRRVQSAENRR